MSRSRGLPQAKRMRHDSHYVDQLGARPASSVGRQIPMNVIDPNPNQPRRRIEGLEDLVASIKEKGVLEPLLVRQQGDRYQIIAGERRYRAAERAGLSQVPCIELDVDDRGCLEISLVENLQRRDLTPFEEADALAQLRQDFQFTHDEIARKLGRSRTSITEMLSLASIPEAVRVVCQAAQISARSTLLQLARLPSEHEMLEVVETIRNEDLSRDGVRRLLRDDEPPQSEAAKPAAAAKPESFVFRFRSPERPYSFTLRFRDRDRVQKRELISALEEILEELRQQS